MIVIREYIILNIISREGKVWIFYKCNEYDLNFYFLIVFKSIYREEFV